MAAFSLTLAAAMLLAAVTGGESTPQQDVQCRRPHLLQLGMVTPDLPAPSSQCLIQASRVTQAMPLIDLRTRQDFVSYHPAGASNQQISQLISQRPRNVVVYDTGRLRQDAVLLCARLQRYGLQDVRVVDGGVAALARHRNAPQAMTLSRLGDTEAAAAMLSGSVRIQSIAPALAQLVAAQGISSAPQGQMLILGQDQAQVAPHFSAGARTSGVYWVGDANRLRQLLQTSMAQERKREDGPGYNPNCSAL